MNKIKTRRAELAAIGGNIKENRQNMKNFNTFASDAGQIMADHLDDYTAEAWALLAIYDRMHGVKIDAATVQEAAKRAQKLADALAKVAEEME